MFMAWDNKWAQKNLHPLSSFNCPSLAIYINQSSEKKYYLVIHPPLSQIIPARVEGYGEI